MPIAENYNFVLNMWEKKLLKVYGQIIEQGVWGTRTNNDLRELQNPLIW
jgi:hypothetical protein